MRIETLACNSCGAPLQVPDAARFVRCEFCHSNLVVRRDDSVAYTQESSSDTVPDTDAVVAPPPPRIDILASDLQDYHDTNSGGGGAIVLFVLILVCVTIFFFIAFPRAGLVALALGVLFGGMLLVVGAYQRALHNRGPD